MKRNYYEVLGLAKSSSKSDVKKAFHRLAKKFHPDSAMNMSRIQAEEAFKEINEAYSVLSNPSQRKLYDYGGSSFGRIYNYQSGFRTYSTSSKRELIRNKLATNESFSVSQFAFELHVDVGNLTKMLSIMILKGLVKGKIHQGYFIHN